MPRSKRDRSSKSKPPGRSRAGWRALWSVGTLIVVGALLLAGQVWLDGPIRNLHLEGSFERVTPVEVQGALAAGLQRGFLSVHLAELQARVEALEWVRRAQVGRRWPDTLVVKVTEHHAVARWGDTGLISLEGEIFAGESRHIFPELPHLAGPPDSQRRVVERYLELQQPLGAANLVLETLTMDERGSWSMQLQGGQTIRIGRQEVEQRLGRFFDLAAPLLRDEFDQVSHVDMRYTNGFSVGWRPVSSAESAAAAGGE